MNIQLAATSEGATLYRLRDTPPKGGIVLLHGSEGGSAKGIDVIAVLLAADGFITLPKPYNKADALLTRPDIRNIALEEVEHALLYMKEMMNPLGRKTGLMGVSRGAELALLLSQLLAEENNPALPDALAVHASTNRIKPAFILTDYQPGIRQLLGKFNWLARRKIQPAWRGQDSHKRTLPNTELEIEKYPNPVLLTHGTEDTLWNVAESRILEQRRRAAKLPTEVQYFAGEGHSLSIAAKNRWLEMLNDFFSRHL